MKFIKKSEMPVSAEQLFAWHENPCAFERLTPPWNQIKVIRKDQGLKPGSEIHFRTYLGPIPITWKARHSVYIQGKEFCDIQVSGPFAKWVHSHRVIPKNNKKSFLEDELEYKLHLGLGKGFAKEAIKQLFHYRHTVLYNDLQVQNSFPTNPLTIAITGASGLIGSELSAFLQSAGHKVLCFVQTKPKENEIQWDIKRGKIESEKLEGIDGVIHLAGENIGSGRWTSEKKKRIRESRIHGTRLLVKTLNTLKSPPKVLLSSSAIGYYGMKSNIVDEASKPGKDFLAQVCKEWETEAKGFKKGRVVILRFGVVLTPKGGVLSKMLFPFTMGLGGKVGSGKQLMSWIAIDDLIYQLYRILLTPSIKGPVNLCAPHTVTNLEFSKTLASVLHRPCLFPIPTFIAKILFGEMGKATMLSSIGAKPTKLEEAKLPFYYPNLLSALQHLLGKFYTPPIPK